MEEFLEQNYALITHFVIISAAVTGIFCLKKYKNVPVRLFIYFLIYVALVELIGNYPTKFREWDIFYLIEGTLFERNYWWFTIFWSIGAILFFTSYYQRIITNLKYVLII